MINQIEPLLEATVRPKVLYHGTNLIAAAAIVKDRKLRAIEPVDDDGLGSVVCTTSARKVARMFAVEFERVNSRLPVGAIFAINARALPSSIRIIPYLADTQGSVDEREFRIDGDIPYDCIIRIMLVGRTDKLKSEWWLERVYEDEIEARQTFGSFSNFYHAVSALVSEARKSHRSSLTEYFEML
jgi:hypothetical protein